MTNFDISNARVFVPQANAIREKFKKMEGVKGTLSITLEITGSINSGDLKLQWQVTVGGWENRQEAKGPDLNECVREVMRRLGWQEENAPLALSYYGDVEEPDIALESEA